MIKRGTEQKAKIINSQSSETAGLRCNWGKESAGEVLFHDQSCPPPFLQGKYIPTVRCSRKLSCRIAFSPTKWDLTHITWAQRLLLAYLQLFKQKNNAHRSGHKLKSLPSPSLWITLPGFQVLCCIQSPAKKISSWLRRANQGVVMGSQTPPVKNKLRLNSRVRWAASSPSTTAVSVKEQEHIKGYQ